MKKFSIVRYNKAITYIFGLSTVALAGVAYEQYCDNQQLKAEISELRSNISKYEQRDGNSFVVERISKQMEDIAYQQMDISDKRREEALFQMRVADEMRSKAESEQRKAEEFARNVVEARNMAEQQKELAVTQQLKAEHARNVADTLSYIALGRSLASLSSTQYLAGNKDASALLAYAAWKFTSSYKGNVNIPVIFKSLSQNSGSFSSSAIHKGGVSKIIPLDNKGHFVSVSRYGEITRWKQQSGKWEKQLLASDNNCSYRDVCTDSDGVIYALSYNGKLQSVANGHVAQPFILPENSDWTHICRVSSKQLLLVAKSRLYFFDTVKRQIVKTVDVPQKVTAIGNRNGSILIFGENSGVWKMNAEGKITAEDISVKGKITAYTWSRHKHRAAVGTESGDIFILDTNGNSLRKLIGHSSRITDLLFKDDFLFSASYDRVVNLWDANATNSEAVALRDYSSWLYCLCSADPNSIFVGSQSGAVSRIVVSPSEMAATIHANLKRDFTADEWSYYVGDNVPKMKLKD